MRFINIFLFASIFFILCRVYYISNLHLERGGSSGWGGELSNKSSNSKIIKIRLTDISWFYFQNEQYQKMQSIHVTILKDAQRIWVLTLSQEDIKEPWISLLLFTSSPSSIHSLLLQPTHTHTHTPTPIFIPFIVSNDQLTQCFPIN